MTRLLTLSTAGVAALATINGAPTAALVSAFGIRVAPGLVGVGRAGHTAITFDDGPDPVSTPAILDALDALECRATFFLLGSMIDAAPDLVRRITLAGHEVAVHGDRHRSALIRTPRGIHDDIRRTMRKIADAGGDPPHWYRPPYGHLSVAALHSARSLGLRTVLWTAWGRDWRARASPESIMTDVARGHLDGGTVLLHDTDATSSPGSWRNTLAALPVLIDHLRHRDLEPGPLRDHFVTGRGLAVRPRSASAGGTDCGWVRGVCARVVP